MVLQVNHKPILIRGAGYSPDLFLTQETDVGKLAKLMALTRDLNLNTIRFEGKFPTDALWDMADEQGMLMIPG